MPHLLNRISAHQGAIFSLLQFGAARYRRANPKISIHLERLYGCPVLLSGVPALVLTKVEIGVIQRHHRQTLCRMQKLSPTTPDCVVYFLAGSLPLSAILHMRQLGLFGMIARLGNKTILAKIGRSALESGRKRHSWFARIQEICDRKLDLCSNLFHNIIA